ncbi:MAG: hypothetical protein ACE5G0_06355 [Rhodothermales bacterium]
MPIFPFLIPIFLFLCISAIVKWSLEYNKWKIQHKAGSASSDNSLRMSELKEMIHQVVEEAGSPLLKRLEAVENRLDDLEKPRLMPAHQASLLGEDLDTLEDDTVPIPRRERVS